MMISTNPQTVHLTRPGLPVDEDKDETDQKLSGTSCDFVANAELNFPFLVLFLKV